MEEVSLIEDLADTNQKYLEVEEEIKEAASTGIIPYHFQCLINEWNLLFKKIRINSILYFENADNPS